MRKLLVSVLLILMLAPALAAAVPPGETKELRAIDFLSADFETPFWLEGKSPLPPVASGRDVTVPPADTQAAISKAMASVSKEYLLAYETMLQGFGSRYCAAPGKNNATRWLYDALLGNGRMTAQYHNFTDVDHWGITYGGSSVVLTLPGLNASSNRVFYVFNHADSMLSFPSPTYQQLLTDCPGADDDASGMAATLETARVLSRFGFQDTIRFAFFDSEEMGLVGSYYWAQKMYGQKENIQGSIDYDMIGTCPGTAQYDLDLYSDPASSWELQYLVGVNDRYNIGLKIYTEVTTQNLPSDITAFKYFGFPCAMGIEETFSSVYHTMQDRVEYLNLTLVEKCAKLAVAAMAEMARMLYVDVGVADFSASNNEPVESENVRLSATISNAGNLNASEVEVSFLADGYPFESRRIWVPANGTNLTFADWKATLGKHQLTVVVDPGYEQADTDRSNNTANLTVTVNDRPRAVLSALPVTVFTNESVNFNGSNSYDSAGVAGYNFSFGDGDGTGWTDVPGAGHAYSQDGVFVATLLVRDAQGVVSNPSSVAIRVLDRNPGAKPGSNVTRAMTFEPVQFWANASDADGTVTGYLWDFGDGATSTEADPVHNYSDSGAYDVRLSVNDDDGSSASFEFRFMVDDRSPFCAIDAPALEGTIEDRFVLTANASDPDGTISGWAWDLGDGARSISKQVKHAYKRPGNYTVRLTVRDDDGSESAALAEIVIIDTLPEAVASLTTAQADTFKRIQFIGERSRDLEGPVTFQWDFGDGNGSIEPSPYHAYSLPGDYNATLTVRDLAGQNDSVTLPAVSIRNRQPKADFRVFGCFTQNGTLYFDGTGSSDPEGPVSYSWDFGDGNSSKGAVAEHIFPVAGNYAVNLTVTDQNGDTNTIGQTITVNPPPPHPPPPKKVLIPEDKTATVNLLMAVVLLLAAMLAVVGLWGATRGRKPEAPREQVPEAQPLPAEGTPPGRYNETAFKEFSPAEEQLRGAPRH